MDPALDALLTLDLDALAANHAVLVRQAGGAKVAPVVKADAYGLGAGMVAARLWAEGARSFFVARLSEGEALRRHLGSRPGVIWVLDGCQPGAAPRLTAANLRPVLNTPDQVAEWRGGEPSALHIDTGMNRLGVRLEEAEILAKTGARFDLILSHLACATEQGHPMNTVQAARFDEVRTLFPGTPASLANTAGTFSGPAYRHQLVRPGIGLYGGGPFEVPHPDLRAVVTLEAPIIQVRDVPAGETVGYGAVWTAARRTRVAILAAGYADGVLRAWGAQGYGWLDGQALPFVGRVSMDLIAIDVTDAPAAKPGQLVELLGPNVLLDDVAKGAGAISYEVLTRLAPRMTRRYIGLA